MTVDRVRSVAVVALLSLGALAAIALGRATETYEGNVRFDPRNQINVQVSPFRGESDLKRVVIRIRDLYVFCDDGSRPRVTPARVVRAKMVGRYFAKTQHKGGSGAETLIEVRGRFHGSRVDGTVLYIRNFSPPAPLSPNCSTHGRFRWRASRVG